MRVPTVGGAGNTVVIPFDERMTQHILIPEGQEVPPASEKYRQAARIASWRNAEDRSQV